MTTPLKHFVKELYVSCFNSLYLPQLNDRLTICQYDGYIFHLLCLPPWNLQVVWFEFLHLQLDYLFVLKLHTHNLWTMVYVNIIKWQKQLVTIFFMTSKLAVMSMQIWLDMHQFKTFKLNLTKWTQTHTRYTSWFLLNNFVGLIWRSTAASWSTVRGTLRVRCSYCMHGTPVTVAGVYPQKYSHLQSSQGYCAVWDLRSQSEESGCVCMCNITLAPLQTKIVRRFSVETFLQWN